MCHVKLMTGDVNFMQLFFPVERGVAVKKEIQCSLSYLTRKIGKDIQICVAFLYYYWNRCDMNCFGGLVLQFLYQMQLKCMQTSFSILLKEIYLKHVPYRYL